MIDKKYNNRLVITQGDTVAWSVKFLNISQQIRVAYFTIKETADGEALVEKTLDAGVSLIDDRLYKNELTYKIQLQSEDTLDLTPDLQYIYDFKIAIGNVVKTIISGIFIAKQSVTGASRIVLQDAEIDATDLIEANVETTPATNGIEYEQDPVAMAKIGDMTNLNTTEKATLVGAINEVNTKTDNALSDISNINTDITNIQGNITSINGDITTINGNITTINGNITALETNLQGQITANRNSIEYYAYKVKTVTNATTQELYNLIVNNNYKKIRMRGNGSTARFDLVTQSYAGQAVRTTATTHDVYLSTSDYYEFTFQRYDGYNKVYYFKCDNLELRIAYYNSQYYFGIYYIPNTYSTVTTTSDNVTYYNITTAFGGIVYVTTATITGTLNLYRLNTIADE